MGAFHGTSANIQGRADPGVSSKSVCTDAAGYDVHNGIDSADFMEMDRLNGNIVNLGF